MSHLLKTLRNPLRRAALLFALSMLLIMHALPAVAADAQEGRLDLSVSLVGDDAQQVNEILKDPSISFQASVSDDKYLFNLDTVMAGQSVFRLLLEYTQDKVAFSLPDVDDCRYEYDADKLLALIQEAAAENQSALPFKPSYNAPEITPDDILAVLSPYGEYLGGKITAGMQEAPGVVDLAHLGITAEGTISVYEPDEKELAGIFNDLADMIEKDEAAKELVDTLAASLSDPEGLGALVLMSASEAGMDLDEMAGALVEGFSELPANLRSAAQDLLENGMGDDKLRIEISSVNNAACSYRFVIGSEEETVIDAGIETDPEQPGDTVCLYMDQTDMSYSITFDSEETPDGLEQGSLTVKMYSTPVVLITYLVEPAKDPASAPVLKAATIDVMGVYITLDAVEGEENTWKIQLRGLDAATYPMGISGADILVHTDTSASPEAPSGTVTDISDYDPQKISELFESLAMKVADRFMEVMQ